MMKNGFLLVVILMLGLCWNQRGAEASPRYILRSRTFYMPANSGDEWDIWLWDRKRKRVVWKRRLDSYDPKEGVHWSKDRRALAIECGIPHRLRVLVWREGYRLRDFGVPGDNDYTMGCAWSSDNRRLLVRAGYSGAVDINVGRLYCFKLERWPYYTIYKLGWARRFAWKSRKTAMYWGVESGTLATLRTPHLWYAP
jgi:hypothetical protein